MTQVKKVFTALLVSPLVGFGMAALLFFLFKLLARDPRLYKAPEGTAPPPFYIRMLLIGTCGGVSYFHGSNDGQKGMGLIMLILVGTVPTAYALNHTVSASEVQTFAAVSTQVAGALGNYASPTAVIGDSGAVLENFVSTKKYRPGRHARPAARGHRHPQRGGRLRLARRCAAEHAGQRPQPDVPHQRRSTLLPKAAGAPKISAADTAVLGNYKKFLDKSTKFIPTWVKVAVALALGLGTMIGWKRIVVTVGEKIGKTHLTYAQGAAAEITAMITIGLADGYRPAGQYNPRPQLRRGGHHGGQQERPADVHHPRYRPRLGLHPARRGSALRLSFPALQQDRQLRPRFCTTSAPPPWVQG